jgi:predicted peptidase
VSGHRAVIVSALLIVLASCGDSEPEAAAPEESPSSSAPITRTHEKGDRGAPMGYYVALPDTYQPDGSTPALIALHGCCHMDQPDEPVLSQEPVPNAVRAGVEGLDTMVVLAPQHVTVADPASWDRWQCDPADSACGFQLQHDHWDELKDPPCTTPDEVHDFIDFALREYQVDPDRIYLTGLSCGAFSTFEYLAEYGKSQIAAAVPIAGDGRPALADAGCRLASVPIWAFHGDRDDVVPLEGSRVAIERLRRCPGHPELELTVYPGTGHDSWLQAYRDPALWRWLLQQQRSAG